MDGSTIVLSLVLTILSYGAAPVILAFFTRRSMTRRGLILFSVANAVIIFFGWNALRYALGDTLDPNTTPAFLWGIVFYFVTKRRLEMQGRLRRREKPVTAEGVAANTHLENKPTAPEAPKLAKKPVYKTPEPESSIDLLAQLRDECEAEQEEPHQEKNASPNRWKVFSMILIVACVSLVVCCLTQYNQATEAAAELEEAEQEYARLEYLYEALKERRSALVEENRAYEKEIRSLKEDRERLRFWDNFAVIVTVSGEKYHTYGCPYIDESDFYIFNIENAKYLGYEPCSYCCK